MWETIQNQLYNLSQLANNQVLQQLNHLNIFSIGIIFTAGLLTSLTPCTLSMLPITIGYISSYDDDRTSGFIQSLWFSLGMATTLAGLGIIATLLGKVYGQVGLGVPLIVGTIAILMGLNQLELLPLQMPAGLGLDWISKDLPRGLRSYFIGLTFGLVASPCSTPVLATLLAWIGSTQNPFLGAGLLLSYAIGYVAPLVLAGTFTSSLKKILEVRKWSGWITPTSGVILIVFGIISIVSRI
jgi:cytochrome c-type biogenesis protein